MNSNQLIHLSVYLPTQLGRCDWFSRSFPKQFEFNGLLRQSLRPFRSNVTSIQNSCNSHKYDETWFSPINRTSILYHAVYSFDSLIVHYYYYYSDTIVQANIYLLTAAGDVPVTKFIRKITFLTQLQILFAENIDVLSLAVHCTLRFSRHYSIYFYDDGFCNSISLKLQLLDLLGPI